MNINAINTYPKISILIIIKQTRYTLNGHFIETSKLTGASIDCLIAMQFSRGIFPPPPAFLRMRPHLRPLAKVVFLIYHIMAYHGISWHIMAYHVTAYIIA